MSLLIPSPSRNALPSPAFVPDELTIQVLSRLTVKPFMRFRCVCKSWNYLISDPTFVKLHLHRSSQNSNFTLVSCNGRFVSFTALRLFQNPPIICTLPNYELNNEKLVGSCNGLLCLIGRSYVTGDTEMWFRFWNPATRTISQRLGLLRNKDVIFPFHFTFGCDISTNTYKVVAVTGTNVKVFSLQDNAWRNILSSYLSYSNSAVYLNGSVNWLEIRNYNRYAFTMKQVMIISIDLNTEILYGLYPPQCFDEMSFVVPNLSVLNDCLCFSHDLEQTHFVIWLMKECGYFGSWTQLLKISYHNLDQLQLDCYFPFYKFRLLPLCLSEKNDTLLLTNLVTKRAILCNWRENRVEQFHIPWWCENYVESLVSIC